VALFLKDPSLGLNKFANTHKIPKGTLQPYVCADVNKRKPIASICSLGRKPIIPVADQQAIVNAVVLKDRLNSGADSHCVKRMVHEISPALDQGQVIHQVRYILNQAKKQKKINQFKAQATTIDRVGAVTEASQRAWFSLVDQGNQECIDKSLPSTENGFTYSDPEINQHFTVNIDEEGVSGTLQNTLVWGTYTVHVNAPCFFNFLTTQHAVLISTRARMHAY
jgi:hypothetical protein